MDGSVADESGEIIEEPVAGGMTDAESDPTGWKGRLATSVLRCLASRTPQVTIACG
ncbi:hypothetical protein N9383_01950 [Granulosicoccus sp.]|nr:hypothetical protein [Granulosicoccus sp.]